MAAVLPPSVNPLPKKKPMRLRRYLHFDAPECRATVSRLVEDPAIVERWRFFPVLQDNVDLAKVSRSKTVPGLLVKPKVRSICSVGHADAALYSHYASLLEPGYEQLLTQHGLSECITAFRSLGKSNVHFADDAFKWIDGHRPCVALAFDVKSFFDTLNHRRLKAAWCQALGTATLPRDHYAVFRSLTRYAFVDKKDAYKALGVSRYNPKAGGRTQLCDVDTFRAVVAPMIQVHSDTKGIPQGTPISALLSNLYMLPFDVRVSAAVGAVGGLYRRYCDDVLCIVPPEHEATIKQEVEQAALGLELTLHPDKFSRHRFDVGAPAATGNVLQYLGLTYDGSAIRLRPSGIGRYYNKMRAAVRGARKARDKVAKRKGVEAPLVPMRCKRIILKFSHLGTRNFITYAHRAAGTANSPAIGKQVKRHWRELNENIARKQKQKS